MREPKIEYGSRFKAQKVQTFSGHNKKKPSPRPILPHNKRSSIDTISFSCMISYGVFCQFVFFTVIK
jgi:hypothetical protein